MECDSVTTAACLYKECDGAEFEASSNVFDCRFIPNHISFEEAVDVSVELPQVYEPSEFITRALQHSKVDLTWDNGMLILCQFYATHYCFFRWSNSE